MRNLCSRKSTNVLSYSFENFGVVLGKVLAPSRVFCQCLQNGNRQLIIKKKIGVFITDLSKVFDCLSHDSLIVKWKACRFSIDSLRLKQDYLPNRKQRTRINSPYNSWKEVLFGIPQGSVLGPLLFNILLCDLFFIVDDIDFSSYADDNTVYPIENGMEDVIFKLQNSSKMLF